jgi:hypothetical protein
VAGGLVADVTVGIVAVVEIVIVFFSILSAENAIATIIFVVFVVIVEVFSHVVAVAEALNNHTVALGAAFKLTTPTRGSKQAACSTPHIRHLPTSNQSQQPSRHRNHTQRHPRMSSHKVNQRLLDMFPDVVTSHLTPLWHFLCMQVC